MKDPTLGRNPSDATSVTTNALNQFEEAWKNSHWWQTIQLFAVRLQMFNIKQFEEPWKNPQWWEPLLLLPVWLQMLNIKQF